MAPFWIGPLAAILKIKERKQEKKILELQTIF
jgi:hypothetical protein